MNDSLPHMTHLLEIMARLRDKETGCPWDVEQNFRSIVPYTIEEAYEVADAIERDDMDDLKSELGDLLLQVVFHAQMASEGNIFAFEDVAKGIAEKMVRRHPHVFGEMNVNGADDVTTNWEDIKAVERKEKAPDEKTSILDDVPRALPALMRAEKLQKRAARVGFDWPDASDVIAKIHEELAEVEEAITENDAAHIKEEIGDLLFVVTNLARKLKIDPEDALRDCNAKFERRFHYVEATITAQGGDMTKSSLEDMDALWDEAKNKETA